MDKIELSVIIPTRNEEWLDRTIQDVLENSSNFTEVIIILDGWLPNPPLTQNDSRVTLIYNPESKGQRAATNQAVRLAKGKYIIRLDADDYLCNQYVLQDLYNKIHYSNADIVYPDHYYGNFTTIRKGQESHHIGGAMFRTSAINYFKFTEGLRGYEGLDFFHRSHGHKSKTSV